ncbi:MAG TPA: hypothetical protein VE688_01655 [Gaiellaceae bacterium]|jgi:hypothetical protein|nr:hypothetical protein [Gaiellaceae bacterium]
MARQGRRREPQPRPPALPPETRTVGQLVAETIRFYGGRFWRSLALGIPVGLIDLAAISVSHVTATIFEVVVAGPLLTLSFVAASVLVSERDRPPAGTLAAAWVAGTVAFIPFPFLAVVFILPGLAWLALVGLVVPVIVIERLPAKAAFRRALELARADYVHALGSLATLALTYFVTRLALFFTLRGGSGAAEHTAGFLADLVLSPIIFLGGGLLYFDQAARARDVGSTPRSRRRDADLHPAVQPDRAGRPDAQIESRQAARGQ